MISSVLATVRQGIAGQVLRQARGLARGALFRLRHRGGERWTCPVCGYRGPFADVVRPWATRRHALCPRCGAMERHRLQFLVMRELLQGRDAGTLRFLHFAPEPFFRAGWRRSFGGYVTADLDRPDVDVHADLCRLPFPDESADVVFASHVLEHVRDDARAIAEIWRVLRPGGMAVLPVPLVNRTTADYPEANPHDWDHWRAPGRDYFDRYRARFREVREFGSSRFAAEHQVWVYEDMTGWPTPQVPLRQSVPGERHEDVVPVCIK